MIKQLEINNFQSCRNVHLRGLGSINVLYGSNNSGKSSILKAMNMPVQSFVQRKRFQWGIKSDYSELLQSYSETVFSKDVSRDISIFYTIEPTYFEDALENLSHEPDYGQHIFNRIRIGVEFTSNDRMNEFLEDKNKNTIYQRKHPKTEPTGFLGKDILWGGEHGTINWDFYDENGIFRDLRSNVFRFFKGMYFFSVDRKPQEWRAPPRKWDRVGIHGENVVSLLNYLRNREEDTYEKMCTAISAISPDLEYTKGPMDEEGQVSITHKSKNYPIEVNTLMSGAGINQTIPIIVQLIYAKEHDTILIEEPELSLYPEAQEVLTRLMVEEALNGKQVFLSTHSDTINMRLWRSVKDEGLSDRFVKCYLCRKEKGETRVKSTTLEESIDVLFSPSDYKP